MNCCIMYIKCDAVHGIEVHCIGLQHIRGLSFAGSRIKIPTIASASLDASQCCTSQYLCTSQYPCIFHYLSVPPSTFCPAVHPMYPSLSMCNCATHVPLCWISLCFSTSWYICTSHYPTTLVPLTTPSSSPSCPIALVPSTILVPLTTSQYLSVYLSLPLDLSLRLYLSLVVSHYLSACNEKPIPTFEMQTRISYYQSRASSRE